MNLLEIICNKLGVEVGEEWKGSDGKTYIINDMGAVWEVNNPDLTGKSVQSNWMRIISGELVSLWEPKIGDYCYMPNIYKKCVDLRYFNSIWSGNEEDKHQLDSNLVFKTKEEAIECANRIIDKIK